MLVTGATGFSGGHLTRRLLREGARVSVLARPSSDPATVTALREAGAQVLSGDVVERAAVREAVREVEIVFHLAALFRQAGLPDSAYHEVNVEGTRHLLDAAEAAGVARFVHCSTVGVHSHIPSPPADESEPYRPGDVYQETKCEGEKLAQQRFASGRLEGVVIRPAMIWGEGDRRTLKLFRGVARRRFPVIGSGRTLAHWVDVSDLAEGFLLAASQPEAAGQTYILAGERPVAIRELVEAIARVAGVKPLPLRIPARPVQLAGSLTEWICRPLGVEPPLYRRRVDFFTKDRSFDTTKARSELGYRPHQDFEGEVRKIHAWYEKHGWL